LLVLCRAMRICGLDYLKCFQRQRHLVVQCLPQLTGTFLHGSSARAEHGSKANSFSGGSSAGVLPASRRTLPADEYPGLVNFRTIAGSKNTGAQDFCD